MRKPTDTSKEKKSVRTSVIVSEEAYRVIEKIAADKKVSIAWVIRDAVEKYLESRTPLFKSEG